MAVIKDNGYGHGFDGVAKCLEPEVDWFCVARAEEGVRMRYWYSEANSSIREPKYIYRRILS